MEENSFPEQFVNASALPQTAPLNNSRPLRQLTTQLFQTVTAYCQLIAEASGTGTSTDFPTPSDGVWKRSYLIIIESYVLAHGSSAYRQEDVVSPSRS